MSDLHRHDDGGPPPVEPDPAGEDPRELDELRRLLIGGEREQLANLQDRVDNLGVEAAEVGSVLPEAIRHCGDQNGELANALAPTIEKSLTASVRKDPQPLADAIFPIIGPAIRKSISETLSRFVQSLNQALEHSISPKGIMWRVEAMRTGRSFAEVVLLRTLAYRVEQVFLIHRENGLLLQHVVATGVDAEDGDMVSGMLTAIEDFVGDSFQAGEGQGLDAMKVGELTVWIEFGPAAFLAAVIRGNAPLSLRPELQAAVESIHRRQAEDLAGFQGDASVFEASRPVLENCLKEARQEQAKGERKKPIIAWILIAAILLPLAWLGYRSFRDQRAWSAFLTDLAAEPGIVVTRSERDGRNLIVEGLRDPLATEPTTLLARSNIDSGRLTTRWAPYHSADPKLALRRVVALLQPPPAVDIRLTDGVLHLMGTADPPWSDRARALAAGIPGIERINTEKLIDARTPIGLLSQARDLLQPPDTVILSRSDDVLVASGQARDDWIRRAHHLAPMIDGIGRLREQNLVNTDRRNWETSRRQLEGRVLYFRPNLIELADDQDAALKATIDDIRQLIVSDKILGIGAVVRITGHPEVGGSSAPKMQLGRRRAQRAKTWLIEAGIDGQHLLVRGLADPETPADQSTEPGPDERVRFHVQVPSTARSQAQNP